MKKAVTLLIMTFLVISAVLIVPAGAAPVTTEEKIPGYSAGRISALSTEGVPDIKDYEENSSRTRFTISDFDGLKKLAELVNGANPPAGKTFIVTNNIDGGGAALASIGNASAYFSGTFDGGGYLLDNFKITSTAQGVGFFGQIKNAALKNIVIGEKVTVSATNSQSAVLAGRVQGTADSYIENCLVMGSVTSTNAMCGGIVGNSYADAGYTAAGAIKLVIKDSTFAGSVQAATRTGGIIGRAAQKVEIINCINAGTVTAANTAVATSSIGTAGILGETNMDTQYTVITSCINTGAISGATAVGGIIGFLSGGKGAVLTDCMNFGRLTLTNSDGTSAGLWGQNNPNPSRITLTNSYNLSGSRAGVIGAEVRLTAGSSGLRFVSNIPAQLISALTSDKAADSAVSFGTVIVPRDYLTHGTGFSLTSLDAAGKTYQNIPADKGIDIDEDGNVTLRAALTDINPANISREFAAVAYLSYTDSAGKKVICYLNHTTHGVSRSVEFVASAALADISETETEEYKYPVDGGFSPYSPAHRDVLMSFIKHG